MHGITKTGVNDDLGLHTSPVILPTLFSFIETYI